MDYQTINVNFQDTICFLRFNRSEVNNAINALFIEECRHVLSICEEKINIIVLEGSPEVFCFGADFQEIHQRIQEKMGDQHSNARTSELMYDLWLKLATGPFITISHVRGKANAGGIGFIAASDIVLADETAQFSLSELLFGLFPACVMPFLVRRVGFQKAHYLTLMTQPILIRQAYEWGLVDAYEAQSSSLLRKHLLRLKRLSKQGITRYKRYMSEMNDLLLQLKTLALEANQAIFTDPKILEGIYWYVEKGKFPWEKE